VSSPAPSFHESRALQFKNSKQLFNPETTGSVQRQNKRNDRVEDKKRVNLENLRSYGPGEALDPPFLASLTVDDFVDEPDDSFKTRDSSEPMSAFMRSMADETEKMEKELNGDDEKSGASSDSSGMSL
jgi:hypothetical protein